MLKRIGLSPGKKPLVFFISAVLITLPLGYAYNSIALILFVLYSLLSAKKADFNFNLTLLLPMLLYMLMVVSMAWSIDFDSTFKALSKEAALLFIPLALCFNQKAIRIGWGIILRNYSIAMCLFGIYFLGRAALRYSATGNSEVFFYHELATPAINAIYLSALFAIPVFYFLSVRNKKFWDYLALVFLIILLFLLSSKTVIVTMVLLMVVYFLFFSGMPKMAKITALGLFLAGTVVLGYYGKINERISAEYAPQNIVHEEAYPGTINNLTINEAWNKQVFEVTDYFNGSAFRAYQIRIFIELLSEDPIVFTGYGLNASLQKIKEKGIEHNVYQGDDSRNGYNTENFHNQYVETFADLGIIGFMLLVVILLLNLKNAVQTKDFIHIAFAILMIALLLTESFLWRQRGVVFFTMFYGLFNGLSPKGIVKAKYEKNTHNRSSRVSGVASL